MKVLRLLALALLINSVAYADLADSCALTNKTACILNRNDSAAQFTVLLPNYSYCGVRFVSDTYPSAAILADFQAGLYVTAGPRWDLTFEQIGSIQGNLTYPVGTDPLFATFFDVYTRDGQTLNDYVHQKLATSYNQNPTVTLIALSCPQALAPSHR